VKLLIVNADDLGADIARNAGIFEAVRKGAVTSASILANGPALEDALQEIRTLGQKNISWGLHLNLSEGAALTPGPRLLAGEDGLFLGKARARKLLSRHGSPALEREVAQELEAQIQALKNAGLRISHLDGHQHIHVFPAVIRSAVNAAQQHHIPWLRIPEDTGSLSQDKGCPDSLAVEAQHFSRLAHEARVHLRGSGIRTAAHFRGLYLKGHITPLSMEKILSQLLPGLTEFMVHPGRIPTAQMPNPFSAFATIDREKELEALLDSGFGQALARHEIELTPFPEAGH
jgi:predicted glycoside hydrolase/deacetylase ChbG (UPF0249 family)